jgi:hypothetical protein
MKPNAKVLPPSEQLDIAAFSKLFANSYKYQNPQAISPGIVDGVFSR